MNGRIHAFVLVRAMSELREDYPPSTPGPKRTTAMPHRGGP